MNRVLFFIVVTFDNIWNLKNHIALSKFVKLKITFSGLVRDSLRLIMGSLSSEGNAYFAILASIWFATIVKLK